MMIDSGTIKDLAGPVATVFAACAAALVAYIVDIRRFASKEKLVAYIGLDSRVHESGTSVHGKGYISKRGNSYLRG